MDHFKTLLTLPSGVTFKQQPEEPANFVSTQFGVFFEGAYGYLYKPNNPREYYGFDPMQYSGFRNQPIPTEILVSISNIPTRHFA